MNKEIIINELLDLFWNCFYDQVPTPVQPYMLTPSYFLRGTDSKEGLGPNF